MSEMGPAAAPMRSERLATNPRAASGVRDVEAVGLPGPERPARPQRDARAVFPDDRRQPVCGAREDLQGPWSAERPLEGEQRDPHVAVERGPARLSLSCLGADDREAAARQPDGTAQRIDGREQGVSHLGADHRHLSAADVFVRLEEPPARDAEIAQLDDGRRRARHRHVLDRPASGRHVGTRLGIGRVLHEACRVVIQEPGLRPPDRGVSLKLLQQLAPRDAAGRRHLRDQERVGAERTGRRPSRVHGDALQGRDDQDDRRDGDGNSQRAESRAQRVPRQGRRTLEDGVAYHPDWSPRWRRVHADEQRVKSAWRQ
jgi:hypothetical protein